MKDKIKKFYKKILERKLVKNFLMIFTGQGISSVFGLFATIMIISAIGSEQHGVLIVIQTYSTLFYSFFSFKTFQALIKYLAQAKKENDIDNIKIYIKWSFLLDLLSLVLMFVFGIVLKKFVISWMNWPTNITKYLIIYLALQIFYLQGTTIGVLRSYEKYNYVVMSQIISNIVRFALYLYCFLTKSGFDAFFIAEVIATFVNYILLIFYTIKVLRENKLLDFYKVKLKYKKEFFMFNIYSNLTSTLDLPINQVTQLIINKYLGFSANSAYSVFEKLGTIINKLGDPINQIIYPEMNLKIVDKDYEGARNLSKKLKKLMLGIFAICFVGTLLTYKLWFHLFIDDVDLYIIPFCLYLAFISYSNAAMGTHNLFMALGYVKYNIPILIIVNSIYLIFLFFSIQYLGLSGVLLAYLIQALGMVVIKEIILKKHDYKEYIDIKGAKNV